MIKNIGKKAITLLWDGVSVTLQAGATVAMESFGAKDDKTIRFLEQRFAGKYAPAIEIVREVVKKRAEASSPKEEKLLPEGETTTRKRKK